MPFWINYKKKSRTKSCVKSKEKDDTDLVKKLDKIFSAYIRLRDCMPSGYFMCISCGKIKHISEADCGHFYSRKHMATRFDEDNCHSECQGCNRADGDHLHGYTRNLIIKIGKARVDALDWKHNQIKRYTAQELQLMIDYYKKKALLLRSQKGVYIKI